jgi:hypothetical protein
MDIEAIILSPKSLRSNGAAWTTIITAMPERSQFGVIFNGVV